MCYFEKIVKRAADDGASTEFIIALYESYRIICPFALKIAEEPALNMSHPNQRKKVPRANY